MEGDSSPVLRAQHPASDHPHSRPHASRAGVLVVVVLAAFTKSSFLISRLHHPAPVIVLCGAVGVRSLLHGRPTSLAASAAVIVPVAISPVSVVTGIAIGVAAFAALMALFVAIGTLLRLSS